MSGFEAHVLQRRVKRAIVWGWLLVAWCAFWLGVHALWIRLGGFGFYSLVVALACAIVSLGMNYNTRRALRRMVGQRDE